MNLKGKTKKDRLRSTLIKKGFINNLLAIIYTPSCILDTVCMYFIYVKSLKNLKASNLIKFYVGG